MRLRIIKDDEIVIKREEYEKLVEDSNTLKRVLLRLTTVIREKRYGRSRSDNL